MVAYLCFVDSGAENAHIIAEKKAENSSAYVSFSVIDTAAFQLPARNDTHLFSTDMTVAKISAEYVLMPYAEQETAYSVMAGMYRERLEKKECLKEMPVTRYLGWPK